MDLDTHPGLQGLLNELTTRWPERYAGGAKLQEVSVMPRGMMAANAVLVSNSRDLKVKLIRSGWWHRGLVGLDVYWRV